MDKFYAEIEDMPALRRVIRALDEAKREAFIQRLLDKGVALNDWVLIARNNQLPPLGDWSIWMIMAGRGYLVASIRGLRRNNAAREIRAQDRLGRSLVGVRQP